MLKMTTSIVVLIAVTLITSAQAEAQFFKSSRGHGTPRSQAITNPVPKTDQTPLPRCGNTPRKTTQPIIPTINTSSGPKNSIGISPFGGGSVATTYRDIRLVGNWTIKGTDGTVTTLKFTENSVTMLKTDEFGDTTQSNQFKWKATTSSQASRKFVFKLKHRNGTIETYQGTLKADRSKCKFVTENGEVMILERASVSHFGVL